MYEFKSWWAGFVITNHTVETKPDVEEIISDLQQKLNAGEVKQKTCGVNITIDSLCIDLKSGNQIIKYINLKAEKSARH